MHLFSLSHGRIHPSMNFFFDDEGSLSHSLCAYHQTDRMTLAFILYRQHHQRQHPGVGNPDISKILGEQWRNLSDENKKKWQALAEVI